MKRFCKTTKIGLALVLVLGTLFGSCKMEKVGPVAESVKDISGNWKIIKATRNGADLTSIVDFSQFRLNFNQGKYSLVNKVPFLVSQNGAYALDDPKYPFKITFTAGTATPVSTAFNFPIVNGARQLTITFSPGCANNTYVYVFQKSN
jgi:hypothetical protein